MEADTQAGTRTQPSGMAETSELTFNLYLPSMDYLKVVFADAYQAPSGDLQSTGAVIFGGSGCTTQKTLPINLHPTCETTDDNDIFIPAGLVAMRFNPTLSTSDLLSFEGTIYAQPSENVQDSQFECPLSRQQRAMPQFPLIEPGPSLQPGQFSASSCSMSVTSSTRMPMEESSSAQPRGGYHTTMSPLSVQSS